MKKRNTLVFITIMVTILFFGLFGVNIALKLIHDRYVDVQLESNRRTAETIASIFEDKLEQNVEPAKLISSFQKSIEGSSSEAGYLCMFGQDEGALLCHPDTSIIGMSVASNNFKFNSKNENSKEFLIDAVKHQGESYGILSMPNNEKSEIAYMVPVKGTDWKISVHQNLDVIESQLKKLRWIAYIGFLLLALIISLFSTWIIKRISTTYENLILKKNEALNTTNQSLQASKKQIEEQHMLLLNHADQLEQEVIRRTADLSKAHQKLGDLEKAKSDFLAIISHEIRTPLNGIIGFSHLLEDELKDTSHQEFVSNIRISGEKLIRFAETALLITQLSIQRNRFDYRNVKLNQLINQSLSEFDEKITEKAITVEQSSSQESEEIEVVPDMIIQCFKNIFDNAIEHTPKNGQIKVSCIKEKNYLEVTIEDSGTGFSDEAWLRQFDLFGADKVMNHTKGYGLGLAAARLIMKAHSGDIRLENCPNGGARVSLQFPII